MRNSPSDDDNTSDEDRRGLPIELTESVLSIRCNAKNEVAM